MELSEEVYLEHYGTLHKSGRFPWGSGGWGPGDTRNQRNKSFLDHVNDLKKQGLSDAQIAQGLEMKSTQLRALVSIASNEERAGKISMAQALRDKGTSNTEIGKRMGVPESTVRSWLAPSESTKVNQLEGTANMLRDDMEKNGGYLDIGRGVENYLGVSATRLSTAVEILKEEGYDTVSLNQIQQGTGLDTRMRVLVPPGVTQRDVFLNKDKIRQFTQYSDDGGASFDHIQPPLKLNPKRVAINYADDGGAAADGVLYVRPGIKDVALGHSSYAQVRVAVGDNHYIKGMAMYKDDLPDGVDIVFNTSKLKKDFPNKLDALKENEVDADNPFGTIVRRQIGEKNSDGTKTVTSVMNIVNEEGDWLKWSHNIASQVLSKQSPKLAKTQLDMTYEARKQKFADIMSMTNPTVRKKLLKEFAGEVDSAAVHLKAAALPRQGWHAILPISSMKPGEIYAPNFRPGETVALIRYPHGGTFEIPELVVNNKQPEAKRLLGQARDAVGIHSSVAERLSGADFDGDTVLVIPNNNKKIRSTPALEGLKDFNPRLKYPGYPGMHVMSNTQTEMGKISNLVTDMTIRNASTEDVARAIRHSMVVIDAEKHKLNYKQSYIDNGIKNLKERYQFDPTTGGTGASTLISRAKSKVYVDDRKDALTGQGGPINPITGARQYEPTNRKNYKTGAPKQLKTTRLAEATDAHTLSSGTPIERLYANHSNRLKAMANQARLAYLNTPPLKQSASAKKVYETEAKSLKSKLVIAQKNAPLERQAQLLSSTMIKAKRDANPNMDDATLKKVKFQALEEARARTGARKNKIEITQEEWNAIQAGAISNHMLEDILNNANMDTVRKLASPPQPTKMTTTKTARAQQMLDAGYTRAEVADHLGVAVSTLDVAIHPPTE